MTPVATPGGTVKVTVSVGGGQPYDGIPYAGYFDVRGPGNISILERPQPLSNVSGHPDELTYEWTVPSNLTDDVTISATANDFRGNSATYLRGIVVRP